MSKVLSSVGKIFKKVVKSAKTILPAALALGAVVFTAGSAMGALPSWGEAVSKVVGEGTLGKILTGAITQAGYGAGLGLGTAAVTGGNLERGLQIGAVGGAVSGGAMGAMGMETDPLKGAFDKSPGGAAVQQGPAGAASQTPGALQTAAAPGAPGASVGAAAPAPAAPGLLGWAEKNQSIVGNVGAGLGMGALQLAGKGDPTEDAAAKAKAEQERINGNYAGSTKGLLSDGSTDYVAAQNGQRPTPSQRFDPRTYGGTYQYNTTTGKIEFVPNANA